MIERNYHDDEASSVNSQAMQMRYETASIEQDMIIFQMLKPELKQDGNQWCVLYGEDLQSGIAGFGESPLKAIRDFNASWYKEIEK